MTTHRFHPASASVAALTLLTAAAQAQTLAAPAVAAPQAKASAAAATTLPEVTVAADKDSSGTTEGTRSFTPSTVSGATGLPLSVRETPQSVTVITRERIEAQGMQTVSDAVQATPGVSTALMDGRGESYSARGFGISSIQLDGVPMTWGSGWDAGETRNNLATIDRVEVVRGAAGLLTGAGNPSASINLIRKRADSPTFTGQAQLELGSHQRRAGMLDLSTPLNADASVRARLIGKATARHTFNDRERVANQLLYGVVDADLSAHTRLSVGADWQNNDSSGALWGGLLPWHRDGSRIDWPHGFSLAPRWASWPSQQRSVFGTLEHRFNPDWSLRLHAQHIRNANQAKLANPNGLLDAATGSGIANSRVQYDVERSQSDLALQAQGAFHALGRRHELVLGAQTSRQKFQGLRTHGGSNNPIADVWAYDGQQPEPEPLAQPELSARNSTREHAVYGATRLHLADPLRLIVGARITHWQKVGEPAAFNTAYTLRHPHVVTPYAGLVLDIDPTWSAYASIARVFNPQERRDREGRYLDPVTGQNLELGVKAAWLNGRLTGSAAVFQTTQDNVAVADGRQTVPGTAAEQAYTGAKGVKTRGYELELVGSPTPGWDVSLGWTAFSSRDAQGQPVNTNRPAKLLKLFTQYRLPGTWSALTLGAGLDWQGRIYSDVKNPVTRAPEQLEQAAYALLNLSARYQFSKHASMRLAVNNVLDKRYWANVGFYDRLTWGAPRSVVLTLNAQF
ncbi:TonB-dependent siderophore receptor [Ottowia testudinis]|uniref:TonB-dependent siderophore receptor n=1 Tax=Ottowia testudinis TaxID=2816950 RepID=A0A975CHM0_9BURK|nr:TonB-dependent siderophore receptor [Ottowia testudinis]QTD46360.1 TonB-dependent siderophore receptor [Ottowia testudinis]